MDPPYHNSPPSTFLDLNIEDHGHHHLFTLNHDQTSSSLSLSSPNFMNIPPQDQGQFYYREPQTIQVQEADHHHKLVSSGGSSDIHPPRVAESESDHHQNDLKLSIWKSSTEDSNYDHDKSSHVSDNNAGYSAKWMPSKMRMMRKMIVNPDQTNIDHHTPLNFTHKFDQVMKRKHPASPLGTDHSSTSSSNNNNNNTIRVCADCNTTKTPLWRSGPRGPKSLCNACGIRQRKARRAMAAAAAAANGTILATDATTMKSSTKVQRKEKKPKNGNGVVPQFKKRCKLTASPSRGRKKICFEDLAISISKNSAFQRVFPQDEKDAAILLMALSYGLVHG
ncbi:Putative GATA transcription factor 22 [Morus notabilis]|uniref:Putative GATA transcription factor 22 n=1 Tax=Morus notabilis TaxID=981085 RepID=W9QJX1_9ROSA|nr:GATA transcription factor 21 [Morus notabilis]EXB38836.1 Putative GATA transcription factor 22 [Morus notabilis]